MHKTNINFKLFAFFGRIITWYQHDHYQLFFMKDVPELSGSFISLTLTAFCDDCDLSHILLCLPFRSTYYIFILLFQVLPP